RAKFAMSEITARSRNATNRIFATPAAPAAIPPKPNSAAMIAITKKTMAQWSMTPPCVQVAERAKSVPSVDLDLRPQRRPRYVEAVNVATRADAPKAHRHDARADAHVLDVHAPDVGRQDGRLDRQPPPRRVGGEAEDRLQHEERRRRRPRLRAA